METKIWPAGFGNKIFGRWDSGKYFRPADGTWERFFGRRDSGKYFAAGGIRENIFGRPAGFVKAFSAGAAEFGEQKDSVEFDDLCTAKIGRKSYLLAIGEVQELSTNRAIYSETGLHSHTKMYVAVRALTYSYVRLRTRT